MRLMIGSSDCIYNVKSSTKGSWCAVDKSVFPLPSPTKHLCLCLFLYASLVSPDARGWVSSAGSVGAGRGFQHWGRPALPRLTTHDLPCDRHQKPLLRPLPEVHANRAVWNCGDTRRNSRDYRWVTAKMNFNYRPAVGNVSLLSCMLWPQAKCTIAEDIFALLQYLFLQHISWIILSSIIGVNSYQ